jgi:hypothetical protein
LTRRPDGRCQVKVDIGDRRLGNGPSPLARRASAIVSWPRSRSALAPEGGTPAIAIRLRADRPSRPEATKSSTTGPALHDRRALVAGNAGE